LVQLLGAFRQRGNDFLGFTRVAVDPVDDHDARGHAAETFGQFIVLEYALQFVQFVFPEFEVVEEQNVDVVARGFSRNADLQVDGQILHQHRPVLQHDALLVDPFLLEGVVGAERV